MDALALYYPNIHIRDDKWLKYAALYWPSMRRIRPSDYPTNDSPVARALQRDAAWLIDMQPPQWAADATAAPFLALINAHAESLRGRFGIERIEHWHTPIIAGAFGHYSSGYEPNIGVSNIGYTQAAADSPLDPRLGYLHFSKVDQRLVEAAVDAGLAIIVPGRGGRWVGMHPELVSAYTCALTERIAAEDHLHPITDHVLPHSALSGWNLEHLMRVLLADPFTNNTEPRPESDLLDSFVFLAFETVVPANLDTVPIEKIIEIRATYGTELDAFRQYVTDQVDQLAELRDVRDLPIFLDHVRTEVDRTVTVQLARLREQLRSVGVESVRALANVKSVALPPLAAAAAETVGLPASVTGPAVLAACVLTAPAQWRRHRGTTIRESPVGYLFQIDQVLRPATLISRLRHTWTSH